ncbi:MAG: hypothetical protein AAB556_01700 [Patescibacteria group bacterium]
MIKDQIKNNCLPHAYLFSGNDSVAKEEAIELIKNHYLSKQTPDFFEINPVEGKISIDEIRILKERSLLTSASGSKNIFLIRGIEHLNREAEVAMLKTIEDLPRSSMLLATCENYASLLPAVKSRFSHLRFFSARTGRDLARLDSAKRASGGKESGDNLEIMIRQSLLKNVGLLRKTLSPLFIFKIEKLLSLQGLLPISALNKRMARDYLDILERTV